MSHSDRSSLPEHTDPVHDDDGEIAFFLRRWLANPLRIGAIAPSAPALTRRMARQVRIREGQMVVELGPGTGAVTRALLRAGMAEDRLVLVERDPVMCDFLARRFPRAHLILGDAADLNTILPAEWIGKVSSVVSSLPLVSFPSGARDAIAQGVFSVLADDGVFVQFTYGLFSPLPRKTLGIEGRKVAFAGINLPPASVWRYTRAA